VNTSAQTNDKAVEPAAPVPATFTPREAMLAVGAEVLKLTGADLEQFTVTVQGRGISESHTRLPGEPLRSMAGIVVPVGQDKRKRR
jgi:hypothetical protein